MNDSNGLDGIQSGDHKRARAITREAQRGCMFIMLLVAGVFVAGAVTGWAITIMASK